MAGEWSIRNLTLNSFATTTSVRCTSRCFAPGVGLVLCGGWLGRRKAALGETRPTRCDAVLVRSLGGTSGQLANCTRTLARGGRTAMRGAATLRTTQQRRATATLARRGRGGRRRGSWQRSTRALGALHTMCAALRSLGTLAAALRVIRALFAMSFLTTGLWRGVGGSAWALR
jgi:hypothetical protein